MDNKCVICCGEFVDWALKDGKCAICGADYPNAHSLVEAMVQTGKKEDTRVNLTENRVREVIYEILSDAGINRKKCEKCGALFFARSPAQKICEICRGKETVKDVKLGSL